MRWLVVSLAVCLASSLATPLLAASGGPIGGYTFGDHAEGVVHNYVDISATGTQVVSGDNEAGTATFPAGVTFSIYGAAFASLRVSTNGYLSTDPTDQGNDADNACPLPAVPGFGGGARLYPFHANLETTVYYEFFDSAEAEALGFAGQRYGVSILQWEGTYFNSTDVIELQAVLFHGTGQMLVQVQTDDHGGATATIGIQNDGATTGLTYSCNTAASVIGGTTAVLVSPLVLSEIRIDQPGTSDSDEYMELIGAPGVDLSGLTLVVLGDGAAAAASGVIEVALPLSASSIDPTGYFVVAESTFTLGTADLTASLNFENDDNLTFLLVNGFSGVSGQDLDTNDDGALDATPWTSHIDVIALIKEPNPPITTEYHYGPPTVGPDGTLVPGHVIRCQTSWLVGPFDPAAGEDTPRAVNSCPVCGDGLVFTGELCDGNGMGQPGETLTCDTDCSLAECGDGLTNTVAGEGCDDGNTTAGDGCDGDCQIEGAGGAGGVSSAGGSSNVGVGVGGAANSSTSGGIIDHEAVANPISGGSCGCRTPSRTEADGRLAMLALLALASAARRRRR